MKTNKKKGTFENLKISMSSPSIANDLEHKATFFSKNRQTSVALNLGNLGCSIDYCTNFQQN